MATRLVIFTFALLIIGTDVSQAQQPMGRKLPADSVMSSVFPLVSYNSNEGFVGGAIYNRYNYKGNIRPFKSYLESRALISTKGFVDVEGRFEQTRSFGQNIRSIYSTFFRRYTNDIFFGIGNSSSFTENRWDNDYYYFKSLSVGFSYKVQYPIYSDTDSRLDLQAGLGTEYHIPYIKDQNSSFASRMPHGFEGGWVNFLNTGLIWENRDNQFDPHRGNRAELELRYSPALISNYALTSARFEYRQYFYLFNWLTVANRVEARHVAGDVPYWELSTLGGENNLRGYPLNRFLGKSSLAYTLELRGWVLRYPQFYNLKLGGQLFTDTGRVFSGSDEIGDLFSSYKQTFGFGGAISIFNPDFIVRGEIGFSEDVNRIYVGVGYLF